MHVCIIHTSTAKNKNAMRLEKTFDLLKKFIFWQIYYRVQQQHPGPHPDCRFGRISVTFRLANAEPTILVTGSIGAPKVAIKQDSNITAAVVEPNVLCIIIMVLM